MVNKTRIRNLTGKEYKGKTVVYQMCRSIRAHDNDALLFAQQLAEKEGGELIVNYVIWNYLWEGATQRFYDWVIPSLQEVEETLRKHSIPLVITFKERTAKNHQKESHNLPPHAGAVVIEQLPLTFMDAWKEEFQRLHKEVPLYEVDSHNCIPVWETSPKQEFAARTIRSKVHAKLPLYIEEFDVLKKHTANKDLLESHPPINWNDVQNKIVCVQKASGTGTFTPGEKAAHKMLANFLSQGLTSYDTSRNEINKNGQSNLSPYISHGNLSRRRIILELLKITKTPLQDAFDPIKNGSNKTMGSIASFIEESVVRAELAENFCFYNKNYRSTKSAPSWAQETLHKASTDKREYTYSFSYFEKAKTHDELWNAAQLQMVTTGKMHGYMRMYWAKKILEWTKSPEEALSIAIKLNDMYELDGREPNGYVGCLWSICGVHDRPWFPRPIFGTIRYMARSGVEKRGDVEEYIRHHLHGQTSLL